MSKIPNGVQVKFTAADGTEQQGYIHRQNEIEYFVQDVHDSDMMWKIAKGDAKIIKYRPSNGTEGEYFFDSTCRGCIYDDDDNPCNIISLSMIYSEDEPEYPSELCYTQKGPTCTAYVNENSDEAEKIRKQERIKNQQAEDKRQEEAGQYRLF